MLSHNSAWGGHSPSLRELDQLPDVATIWYRLGLQLGVSAEDLDMIEKNYPQDADMRKIKMFAEWQRGDINSTYEKLVRALAALGKRKLAESVCSAQGISLSVLDAADATHAIKTHQSHDPTPTAAVTGGKEEDAFRHHRAAKPSRSCVNDGSGSSSSSESGLGSLSEGEPLKSPDFRLEHPCGCKQCTLHKFCDVGCPNPDKYAVVPVLSENTSADASLHQFHLEAQRQHETKQIMTAFASLVNQTRKSIKKKVPVNEFVLWLKQLEAFKKVSLHSESAPCLLAQQMNEISQAGSIEQVFLILSDYWSWYNHYLVEEIIIEYGDEEDQRRLDGFKEKFSTFAHNRIVEFSRHPMTFGAAVGDRKTRIPLLFKVDRNWDTVHINQLSEIHRNLASIFEVNPHTLYLASIRKGCILMKFLIPSSVAQAVFPLSASRKDALAATDITLVKCGSHCHIFLPHSRPQGNVADSPPQHDAVTTVMRTRYWPDVTPPESALDSECDEGSSGDLTSGDNAADSSSVQLASDDSSSDSEEKGSEAGTLELVKDTLKKGQQEAQEYGWRDQVHQQIPQTPTAIEVSGSPECDEGSSGDPTSGDNAADSSLEQQQQSLSSLFQPSAEVRLEAKAGTLDCVADQSGTSCAREQRSLQFQLTKPTLPEQRPGYSPKHRPPLSLSDTFAGPFRKNGGRTQPCYPQRQWSHSAGSSMDSTRHIGEKLLIGGGSKLYLKTKPLEEEEGNRLLVNTHYKTELCRPYLEYSYCKYGDKCQFAHGKHEVREVPRYPKYKTELCRSFHSKGFCPYGSRCHFIHNMAEARKPLHKLTSLSFPFSPSLDSGISSPDDVSGFLGGRVFEFPGSQSSRSDEGEQEVDQTFYRRLNSYGDKHVYSPPRDEANDKVKFFSREPVASPAPFLKFDSLSSGRASPTKPASEAFGGSVSEPDMDLKNLFTGMSLGEGGSHSTVSVPTPSNMHVPNGHRLPVFEDIEFQVTLPC